LSKVSSDIPTGSLPPDLILLAEWWPQVELIELSTSGMLRLHKESLILQTILATSMLLDSCQKATVVPILITGLASCSDDKTIKVYDLRSNQLLQHYNAHKGRVNDISFHPTGLYMASCSDDSKVKIWDLRKGKALYSLFSHTGSVEAVDFSFAGDYFATGGDDKNLLLWKSNFYDSKTTENNSIPPKTKVVNEKVVKFTSKVEPASELESPIQEGGDGNLPSQVLTMYDTRMSGAEESSNLNVIEVGADEKINSNLDKIMNQMDKLFIMLKVISYDHRTWRPE
jgi:WD40 repeat protein